MRLRIAGKLAACFLVPTLILSVGAAVAVRGAHDVAVRGEAATQTLAHVSEIQQLVADVHLLESELRGYAATGDKRFATDVTTAGPTSASSGRPRRSPRSTAGHPSREFCSPLPTARATRCRTT